MLMIKPVSSAVGMKSKGETRPRVGWRQRINASKPLIRRSGRATIGWKKSSIRGFEGQPQIVFDLERV